MKKEVLSNKVVFFLIQRYPNGTEPNQKKKVNKKNLKNVENSYLPY